jgi:hypothetical protein
MIARFTRHLAVSSCLVALAGIGAAAPAVASHSALPAVSCAGSTQTAVSPSTVTVTGTATCTGAATLKLTTTTTVAGVQSSVSSLLAALPNLPVPINQVLAAVGVSAACSVLADNSTGATVATSCSA